MIEEVQVIRSDGIPVYHYTKGESFTDGSFLEASFFTAINSFGTELGNGEIREVIFSGKKYLVKSSNEYIIIFSGLGEDDMKQYQESIVAVSKKLDEYIADHMDSWKGVFILEERSEEIFKAFNEMLREMEVVDATPTNYSTFQNRMNNLLFKAVGYEPGRCNIGQEGVYARLYYAMASLVVSLVILLILTVLGLPPIYRLLTIPTNFGAILAYMQARNRFCVSSALQGTVNMR